MLKIIFRILFLGLGLFTTYTFGRDTFEPIWHRLTGTVVEGRISGFLTGRNSPSVQREPTGVRKGKTRARRPVFVYPTAPAARDSLEGRSNKSDLHSFDTDPKLDATYHLLANSPCINAGVDINIVTRDIDGHLRSDGAHDVGADEFGSVTAVQGASQITDFDFKILGNPVPTQLVIEVFF